MDEKLDFEHSVLSAQVLTFIKSTAGGGQKQGTFITLPASLVIPSQPSAVGFNPAWWPKSGTSDGSTSLFTMGKLGAADIKTTVGERRRVSMNFKFMFLVLGQMERMEILKETTLSNKQVGRRESVGKATLSLFFFYTSLPGFS